MDSVKVKRGAVTALIALGSLLWCRPTVGLDPSLRISQYAHTGWSIQDGFFKGAVRSIAQTPDGYLWLATEFGLVRFDGAQFVPWVPPNGQKLPSTNIRSVMVARDGTLWIGTLEGLASWKDDKLNQYAEFAGQNVLTLLQDRHLRGSERETLHPTARNSAVLRAGRQPGPVGVVPIRRW